MLEDGSPPRGDSIGVRAIPLDEVHRDTPSPSVMLSEATSPMYPEVNEFSGKISCGVSNIQYGRRVYKAPFKVSCMSWNPNKERKEIFALASSKGDVIVRRGGFKKCWQVNLEDFTSPFYPNPVSHACIVSLVWSPDGEVLCAGTKNGYVFFMDVDEGRLLYSYRVGLEMEILRMRWDYGNMRSSSLKMKEIVSDDRMELRNDVMKEEMLCGMGAPVLPGLDEATSSKVINSQLLIPLYTRSMQGTFLLVILENLTVQILAGGILHVASVNYGEFFEKNNLYVVQLHDALLLNNENVGDYTLVAAYSSHGKPPVVVKGKKFGDDAVSRPLPGTVAVGQTHLVGQKVQIFEMSEEPIWVLAMRMAKLYVSALSVKACLDSISSGWKHEMKKIIEKFDDEEAQKIDLADFTLAAIIGGSHSAGHRWFERTFAHPAMQEMRDVHEKKLGEILLTIRAALRPAADVICFEMSRFGQECAAMQEALNTDGESLLFPRVNEDVNVYPIGQLPSIPPPRDQFLDQLVTDGTQLITVIKRCEAFTTNNYSDLNQWICFFSLLDPMLRQARNADKTNQLLRKYRLYDHPRLLKIICRDLLPPEEAQIVHNQLFHMKDIAENSTTEVAPLVLEGMNHFSHDQFQSEENEDPQPMNEEGSSSSSHQLCDAPQLGEDEEMGTVASRESSRPPLIKEGRERRQLAYDKVSDLYSTTCSIPPSYDERFSFAGVENGAFTNQAAILGVEQYDSNENISVGMAFERVLDCVKKAQKRLTTLYSRTTFEWAVELVSSSDHSGFESLQLERLEFNNPLGCDPLESELRRELGGAEEYENAICISAVGKKSAHFWVKTSVFTRTPVAMPDVHFDFSQPISTRSSLFLMQTKGPEKPRYYAVDHSIRGNEDVVNCLGYLVSVDKLIPMKGGYFFALCTFRHEDGSEETKMCKGSPVKPLLMVTMRDDGTESAIDIALSNGIGHGATLIEGGSKLALFDMLPQVLMNLESLDSSDSSSDSLVAQVAPL